MYRKPAKHSFRVFTDNLKSDRVDKVLLLYGVEQYLVKWAVETLVKTYVNPAAVSMDYVILDEEKVTCSQIIEACETFSMFSQRRIVWVRDLRPREAASGQGFS